MPAKDESLNSVKKPKKELDISKLARVKNKKIARTFRRKAILEVETKLDIRWRRLWAYAAVIAVSTLVVYGTSLCAHEVFNDPINMQIKTLGPQPDAVWLQLVAMAQQIPFNQPWTQATYYWDTQSFPGIPAWYHIVNVMLHLLSSIYLFLFSFQVFFWMKEEKRIKFNPYDAALASAMIFMCHPLATGAVSYISARSGLLCTLNLFLALNLFMLGFYSLNSLPIICFYFAAIILLGVAILCGSQAVFFPLLFIALALLLKPPKEEWQVWFKERWQDFAIFALAAAAALSTLLTKAPALLDNGVDTALLSRIDYTLLQAGSLVTYFLRYLLVPIGITMDQPSAGGMEIPLAALGCGVLAALAYGTWWLRKYPLACFGGLISIVALLANYIFVQHEIVSDNRFYVALTGIALIAGTLLAEKLPFTKKNLQTGIAVLALLSGLTIWRETFYLNDISLWTAAGNSARSQGYLAGALYKQGNEKGKETAQRALALDPKNAPANEALGLLNVSEKKFPQAVTYLKIAEQTARDQQTVPEKLSWYQQELADAAMRANDWKVAKEMATEALKVRPGLALLHLSLGQALLAENNLSEAYEELKFGADLDRLNPEFLEPTADCCARIGSVEHVLYGYQVAKRASKVTRSLKANLLYGLLTIELGKVAEAKQHLEALIKSRGPIPEACFLLAYADRMIHDDVSAKKLEAVARAADPNIGSRIKIRPVDLTEMRKRLSQPRYVEPPANEAKPGPTGDKPPAAGKEPAGKVTAEPTAPTQTTPAQLHAGEPQPGASAPAEIAPKSNPGPSGVAPDNGITGGAIPQSVPPPGKESSPPTTAKPAPGSASNQKLNH